MKKMLKNYKKLGIMIVTLLLSFTLISGEVHAYIPDNTFYYGKTELIDYDVSDDTLYYTNTIRFRFTSSESSFFPNDYEGSATSLLDMFNIFKAYKLNNSEFATINKFVFANDQTLLLLRAGQVIDTIGQPYQIIFDLEGDTIRFINKDEYPFYVLPLSQFDVSDVFTLKTKRYFTSDNSYDKGYADGLRFGRITYAYFQNGRYYTAEEFGFSEYNRGYDIALDIGLEASQGEAYQNGYDKGSKDSFMASIKDWIVPAIIVVLFLGGAVTIIAKKREG